MLVVYASLCETLPNKDVYQVELKLLESKSLAWMSAEEVPESVFLMFQPFVGRVVSQVQRDEFKTCYVDSIDHIALIIINPLDKEDK